MGATSGFAFSLVYYVAYIVIALTPFIIERRPLSRIDPLEPYIGLSVVVFFYSASALIGFQVNGLVDDLEAVSPYAVLKFAAACLVGQAGFACGELIGTRRTHAMVPTNAAPRADEDRFNRILAGPVLALVLLMLPFYWDRFNFVGVESYADTAFESRIARMDDPAAGLKDIFLRDTPAFLLLCAATIIFFDYSRALSARLLAAAVFFAYLATSLLSGARAVLAAAALVPLVYFHYKVRRLSKGVVIAFGIGTYLLINVLSVARLSSDPIEMIDLVAEKVVTEGYGFLDISQSGELRTSVNLVRLIVGLETGEESLRLGYVTYSNVVSSIPRVFWPDRPLTGAELFAEVFYPGSLSAGVGYGSFIFQEPYWDFGFAGVFVFSAFLAWFLRAAYSALVSSRASAFMVLLYAIIYGQLVLFVARSGIFAGLKSSLVAAVPLLAIVLLSKQPAQTTSYAARLGE